jgi:histidinol phosphatase-like enzyme
VWDDDNLRNGVAEYCRDEGIRLIAYRPLGGDRALRLTNDETLRRIADRHASTAQELALAWLSDLGAVPIPGATRIETARSSERALHIVLDDDDRRTLDARFSGRLLRVPRAQRRPSHVGGDVVLVMGMPAAGKSSLAQELVAAGYQRLNRDERGGTLSALARALDAGLAGGERRWVLDNTYPTRRSRNEVIETAWAHGAAVRCVHLTTSVADAQVNAIHRMLQLHGRLPMPEDLRRLGKGDPRFFGPEAQFRYERSMEPPADDEGFESIETREFTRRPPGNHTRPALVLECDDVLVRRASGGDGPVLDAAEVALVPHVAEFARRKAAEGWLLFAQAWRPQIARGEVAENDVAACFERVRELLHADIVLARCSHDAGPPVCWCRKPLPGLILEFASSRGIDLQQSIYIGRAAADRTTAQRLRMRYLESGSTAITNEAHEV